MKKPKKVRLLPLDYLESIGRYRPLTDHAPSKGVYYPDVMMRDLERNAGKVFPAEEFDQPFACAALKEINHKKYIKL